MAVVGMTKVGWDNVLNFLAWNHVLAGIEDEVLGT